MVAFDMKVLEVVVVEEEGTYAEVAAPRLRGDRVVVLIDEVAAVDRRPVYRALAEDAYACWLKVETAHLWDTA